MTFKETIRSLSFVLAASVSSMALAQGLGVAADAQVGVGSAQAAANPDSSLNNRSSAIGSDSKGAASAAGSSVSGVTPAIESSGKSSVGTGLDTAAATAANPNDAPIKVAKAKKIVHAKKSTKARVDLDAGSKP